MWLLLHIAFGHALPFVSTWRTSVSSESVTLPFSALAMEIEVNWGDGNVTNYTSLPVDHMFASLGQHNISVSTAMSWSFLGMNCSQLVDISSWGDFIVDNTSAFAFAGCSNLMLSATDAPTIVAGATLEGFFKQCSTLNSALTWYTDYVQNMRQMFYGASSFNSQLSFNTSGVQNMDEMFSGTALTQSVAGWPGWDTQHATSCTDFCVQCGLPAFLSCTPCGGSPRLNTSTGAKVCACPLGEVLLSANQCGLSVAPTASPAPTSAPTTLTGAPTTLSVAPTSHVPTESLAPSPPTTMAPTGLPCPSAFIDFFLLCFNEDFNIDAPSCSPGCVTASVGVKAAVKSVGSTRATDCFTTQNARRNHFDSQTTPYLLSALGKGVCDVVVSEGRVVGSSFLVLSALFLSCL